MTQHASHPAGDAERDALATLIARFSADRDALVAGVQRAEAGVQDLGARLDLGPIRFELGRLESLIESMRDDLTRMERPHETAPETSAPENAAVLMTAVDEVRAELRRMAGEITQQAALRAERAAAGVAESSAEAHRSLAAALAETRTQLTNGLADVERRGRDLESLRTSLAQVREEMLRRVGETEARLGVRLDSIVAGVEAETRAVRDSLWDRVAGTEQRLHEAEELLAGMRVQFPQAAAHALEGIAAVHGELEQMRDGLGMADGRLAALEQQRRGRSGFAGVVDCVREEIVAAVMLVASLGAVVGRLTLSLVR